MPAALALLLVTLQGAPDSTTAYLDPGARALVQLARATRDTVDRSIRRYQVVVRERIALDIRALRRDRRVYRREIAAKVDWRRDTVGRIEVLGAREQIPIWLADPRVPDNLRGLRSLAFDPAGGRIELGLGDSSALRHPLAPGSEAHYRFASGDTTVLTFPDGRTLKIVQLQVIPRRSDFRLMNGTLSIDIDRGSVVRALFRPARAFDVEVDADKDDDIPGFMKPLRAEVRLVAIEYGLWERRWWLPRLIAVEAVATAGSWLQTPLRFDRVYGAYEVESDPERVPVARASLRRAPGDTTARRQFDIELPRDTAGLLVSDALPPEFAGMADTFVSRGELDRLADELRGLPGVPRPVRFRAPRWGLARYNRIEGLSLGARAQLELGPVQLDGAARLGLADLEPDAELGVSREGTATRVRLGGYRRLAAVDPRARPLALGNSLNALLLGRDDGDYVRAAGGEVTVRPVLTLVPAFSLRVYAERQRAVAKETDASVAHLIDSGHRFRPNIVARDADQIGVEAVFRAARPGLGAEMALDAAGGTFGYLRAALTVRTDGALPGPFVGALELAGGSSAGTVPLQSHWPLGGAQTLRGYPGAAVAGDAFWRARAEVANELPAARVALFVDLGRAGPRETLSARRPLIGAGVGASFLDGLVRIDLARALRGPVGWRLDVYADGVL
ncbi:MAG TPA: hypothetical protein VGA20_01870 [Gemmatimonadales bacterium]